jgi:hypothetical protein
VWPEEAAREEDTDALWGAAVSVQQDRGALTEWSKTQRAKLLVLAMVPVPVPVLVLVLVEQADWQLKAPLQCPWPQKRRSAGAASPCSRSKQGPAPTH